MWLLQACGEKQTQPHVGRSLARTNAQGVRDCGVQVPVRLAGFYTAPPCEMVSLLNRWHYGGSEKWGGQNKPYTVAAVRRAITRACDAAGVDRWTPYDLKTAGATAVERDRGLDAVKALCNHTTVRTSEIYVVRDLSLAEVVARDIG